MRKIISFIIILIFAGQIGKAQVRSTNESRIVVVVDSESDLSTHLALFNTFQEMNAADILERYPTSRFYAGHLKGNFQLDDKEVIPMKGAIITIYTERQILPGKVFFSKEELSSGVEYNLGETRASVISNKKGELILQAQS